MSKLYFRYGAMNSGKSTGLLQTAYNYSERDQVPMIIKPSIDTKGETHVVSRLGASMPVDVLVSVSDDVQVLFQKFRQKTLQLTGREVSCLLVDEAQFLTPLQVDQLLKVAVQDGVPVIAYGIRTDFKTEAFPGSRRLLEVAHSLEELKTICRCGNKATLNARKQGKKFVFEGDQVAIDNDTAIEYESLCPACYLRARGKFLS